MMLLHQNESGLNLRSCEWLVSCVTISQMNYDKGFITHGTLETSGT